MKLSFITQAISGNSDQSSSIFKSNSIIALIPVQLEDAGFKI
ncbi:hypothetical protein BCU36_017700 [Vibrio lentus]